MPESANKSVFKRLCTVCFWFLIATGSSADQETDYQKSIDTIGKQIEKISTKLNADKALLKTEQSKLASAEQKVAEIGKLLAVSSAKIAADRQESERIDKNLATLSLAQAKDKEALAKLIRERYMRGQPNYIKMLLNQENPYAVGRLSNYYDYFSAAQQLKLSEIHSQIAQTQALQQTRQKLLEELEHHQQQQVIQQQELSLAKASRSKSVARLNQKVAQSSDSLQLLRQDRARLNRLLEQIAAQAEELRRLQRQQVEEERRRQQQQPQPGKSEVTRPLVTGGFLKQRGRLRYPVTGTQKYHFGSRLLESGMRAQGTFFDTIEPVLVKTIFRGRVLFADYLKGYGLLMIVDHGDDHISLYGHNELLYKKVGDLVETNEIVARTGISGGLKAPGLYFEIRKNATPVDPAEWCR